MVVKIWPREFFWQGKEAIVIPDFNISLCCFVVLVFFTTVCVPERDTIYKQVVWVYFSLCTNMNCVSKKGVLVPLVEASL